MQYCTITQLANDPSLCFKHSQIRYFISNCKENGLAYAIRRIGKRIYVRRDLFLEWIEIHSEERQV